MNLTELFKREKELSSLQLDKPDLTYQVWELGTALANMTSQFLQLKVYSRAGKNQDPLQSLVNKANDIYQYFQFLCNKLGRESVGVLGDISETKASVEAILKKAAQATPADADHVLEVIHSLHNRLYFELRAKSVHLANVFACGFGLKHLRSMLVYNIDSENVEKLLDTNIENLEKLEKGDKVLTSPNLEITPHILRILKFRLKEIKANLDKLIRYRAKDPEAYERKMIERGEILENLILDIKNPSDYISRRRRVFNNLVPIIIGYYLIVILIILLLEIPGKDSLELLEVLEDSLPKLAWSSVPVIISLLWGVFRWFRDKLIIRSYKFRWREFKTT